MSTKVSKFEDVFDAVIVVDTVVVHAKLLLFQPPYPHKTPATIPAIAVNALPDPLWFRFAASIDL